MCVFYGFQNLLFRSDFPCFAHAQRVTRTTGTTAVETPEEVTVRDCGPLFEILARGDGNGQITITEFCKGLMSIKGQARALDIVVLG